VIPDLPVRRVAPQRRAPRVRHPASTQSSTRPMRKTAVEVVAVGIVDLVLMVALFHPGIVRSIFTSLPMTVAELSATVTTATSWGGA
jgi:hypothetical protein